MQSILSFHCHIYANMYHVAHLYSFTLYRSDLVGCTMGSVTQCPHSGEFFSRLDLLQYIGL